MLEILHTAIHKLLYSIAMEHYEKYKFTSQKYNLLTDNNKQWDLLSHTKDENEQYFSLYSKKTRYAIITVVFIVMSLEGLINEYGLVYLGKKRFIELERESIRDKIVTFFTEVTGNMFPTDRKLYQRINEIIDVRNTLVHNKSVEIDVNVLMRNDAEAVEIYYSYINSMIGNGKRKFSRQKGIERVLELSHNVYIELMEYLQQNTGKK